MDGKASRQLTIGDIAQALGVSKTTVSRAISGKGRISAATVERINAFISENNYKPNLMARGLAQQRSYNIGVICPKDYDIFNLPFFHKCLRGIGDVTAPAGYDMLMCLTERGSFHNLERIVDNHKVDGIILTRTMKDDPLPPFLKERGVPCVAVGSSVEDDVVYVDNDHVSACCELTRHILRSGARRLALIGKDEGQIVTCHRERGFRMAFELEGLDEEHAMVYLDGRDARRVANIVAEAYDKGADGIACMDEEITAQALTACRHLGIRVPQDLKLCSFYDSASLSASVPPISAIEFDDRQLGAAAAGELLKILAGERGENHFNSDYQINLRESTM